MFGVVVCPKCVHARGVSLSSKKTKCPRCGASSDTRLLRLYFISNNEREIAEAVRSISLQLLKGDDRKPDFEIDGDIRRTVAKRTGGLDKNLPTEREISDIICELIEKNGYFSLQGFETILKERFPRSADRIVTALKEERGHIIDEGSNLNDDRSNIYLAASRDLTSRKGDFSSAELAKEMDVDEEKISEIIENLLGSGCIAELPSGRYRSI